MKTTRTQYKAMVKQHSPKSRHLQHYLWSFGVGGGICVLGECLRLWFEHMHWSELQVRVAVPCVLVFLTAVTTATGVFDKLGKLAGAGTGVPITGFANSIVAPAMEHHSEGFILGVGANLFKMAGPVLTYGTAVCSIYGLIYFFFLRK